jgi:hypothetical protein
LTASVIIEKRGFDIRKRDEWIIIWKRFWMADGEYSAHLRDPGDSRCFSAAPHALARMTEPSLVSNFLEAIQLVPEIP